MAGENDVTVQNQNYAFLLQMFTYDEQANGLKATLLDTGITENEYAAEASRIRAEYIRNAESILAEAGFDGSSEEDLLSDRALNTQVNNLADEMSPALAQEIFGKIERGEYAGYNAAIQNATNNAGAVRDETPEEAPAATPASVTPTETEQENTEPEAEDVSAEPPAVESAEAPAVETTNLNTETYSGERAQIKAMQEVMGLPAVVAVTGMELSEFGDRQTGEADGVKGSGTDAAFAALAEASGGRPDIAVYLQEIGVDDANAQKFAMAYASYKGAGNPEPLVLAENPNAVADIQTAFRANDEQIGLSLNGIDVNTGSAEARDQSDNTLGPLTARSIQGTVALAVRAQTPEGTVITHDLTEENIRHVQDYLTEQGVEGADAIAANLRRVADDPALSTQYANSVVAESIEYAGLTVPGSDAAADDVEVASVAEEVDQNTNGPVDAIAAAEAEGVVPVSLGGDFSAETDGGLATATLTVSDFEAMRNGTNYETAGSDEIRILGTAALELEGIPAYQERASLISEQAEAIEEMRSGAVQDAARAKFEESNVMDAALTAELRSREIEFDYTYKTGRNGQEQTHTATYTGSMEAFEEEYGSWNNQANERTIRAGVEAAYAEFEADPSVVEQRAEIAGMREEALGMEQAHAAEFAERRDTIAALDTQLSETEMTIVIPNDIDPALAETMITDAGGTYTAATPTMDPEAAPVPGTPVTPKADDGQLADNPAAGGDGDQMAEDTTAVPAGEMQALNTQTVPGFGATRIG